MKDFKKYYIITAAPEDVYKALTVEITVMLWTGSSAQIQPEPGMEFEMWDGSICGRFLELEPEKKIVQEWYFGEQEEDSIVTIKLHPHKKGCSAELVHTNIPDEVYEEMVDGWDNMYFGALQDFYDEEKE
jgi:activator of HSP90 ATPase